MRRNLRSRLRLSTCAKQTESSAKQESCNIHAEFLPHAPPRVFVDAVSGLKHIFNEIQYELTRKIAEGEITTDLYGFLTTEPNAGRLPAVRGRPV